MSRVVPIGEVTVAWAHSAWAARPSRRTVELIDRDGQIVPLLVRPVDPAEAASEGEPGVRYMAADSRQAERLGAIRQLGWDTVLVETEWTEEDL